MIDVKQAQEVTGIPSGQLLLLALTGQFPSYRDPETRLILFDPTILMDMHGRRYCTYSATR